MRRPILLATLFGLLLLFFTGCGNIQNPFAPPTLTSTPTATFTPTKTPKPTSTPKPTATPDVVATQRYTDLFAQVQKFKEKGHIPTTEGTYIELPEYHKEWAQRDWSSYTWYDDYQPENFVLTANLSWSTADETSRISGCGVVFGAQENSTGYAMYLDKARIYFTYNDVRYYYELGKTRGTGRLQFGNPAQARLNLVVYDHSAYVYVNDEFIGEYSLSKDKPVKGYFGYGTISGTNRDYGTRCDITDALLWQITP